MKIERSRKIPHRIDDLDAILDDQDPNGEVRIERMGDYRYCLRIGEREFVLRAAAAYGPPLELMTASDDARVPQGWWRWRRTK